MRTKCGAKVDIKRYFSPVTHKLIRKYSINKRFKMNDSTGIIIEKNKIICLFYELGDFLIRFVQLLAQCIVPDRI